MAAAVKAGAAYALIIFAIGFALGAIRVLLVVPRLGAAAAVMLQAPIMLAVSWKASQSIADRLDTPPTAAARSLMGAVAFAVLMLLELGVSLLVFGRSVAEYFGAFASLPGAIGLAAQIAFAVFPLAQIVRR